MSKGLVELEREVRMLDQKVQPTLHFSFAHGRALVTAELRMAVPRGVSAKWANPDDPPRYQSADFRELHVKKQVMIAHHTAEDPEARRTMLVNLLTGVSYEKNKSLVEYALSDAEPRERPAPGHGLREEQDKINKRELEDSDSPVWGTFSDLVKQTIEEDE